MINDCSDDILFQNEFFPLTTGRIAQRMEQSGEFLDRYHDSLHAKNQTCRRYFSLSIHNVFMDYT